MVFVSEWERDSCIIRGEEWLCLSITVRKQHSSSTAALIEPHRATLCLSTPPKAINSQTRKNQIFISDLFIFKSCLLKVTKEQNCLWQAHYNDSMTYCVRHEQLWSSSIILWVKSCVHYCCLPDEEIWLKKKLDCLTKIIVLWFIRIQQNATLCNKYNWLLWFHKYSSQNSPLRFVYNDTNVTKNMCLDNTQWLVWDVSIRRS